MLFKCSSDIDQVVRNALMRLVSQRQGPAAQCSAKVAERLAMGVFLFRSRHDHPKHPFLRIVLDGGVVCVKYPLWNVGRLPVVAFDEVIYPLRVGIFLRSGDVARSSAHAARVRGGCARQSIKTFGSHVAPKVISSPFSSPARILAFEAHRKTLVSILVSLRCFYHAVL
jgi:hypothetical protein